MTSLKARLRTAALANSTLTGLLGTNPFRWYDQSLQQGSSFPAVVVQVISNPAAYAYTGQLLTSYVRVQFTIWGAGADSSSAEAVANAVNDFLKTFNGDGISGRVASPNFVVNERDAIFPQSQPPKFQILLDVMIFNNSSL